MAERKLKRRRSQSPIPRSIHQSGDHASLTFQGSYNDVGRDQNNTYIGTYLGGKGYLAQSRQILTELRVAASQQAIDQSVGRIAGAHALVRLF